MKGNSLKLANLLVVSEFDPWKIMSSTRQEPLTKSLVNDSQIIDTKLPDLAVPWCLLLNAHLFSYFLRFYGFYILGSNSNLLLKTTKPWFWWALSENFFIYIQVHVASEIHNLKVLVKCMAKLLFSSLLMWYNVFF